jgi:Kef-type K+ transport system membrane component KefB
VQLLLFHLGRELSFAKLKAVWSVALVGGALQIVAISALGGVVAAVLESPITQVGGGAWYCITQGLAHGSTPAWAPLLILDHST